MAADVTTFIRTLNGYEDQKKQKTTTMESAGTSSAALITRDLLGGCSTLDSKELDLDLQVPSGWEKRLDLKSGKVYIQRCKSPNNSPSLSTESKKHQTSLKLEDINFPPQSKKKPVLNLLDDTSLGLRLFPSSSTTIYQSVCTLDKVKSALERAEKETKKKRSASWSKSSSPPSNSSCSIMALEDVDEEKSVSSFAAGCPGCLLYVLISKSNPQCPRCHTHVPLPEVAKRARIDLNISI
ncbi:uncharacterized protein LOC124931489 [Impatiens glandulifera]|uniref:uncharacterized protein LOC124931489 n=1 Tax=Impatiens glandulifera TaxID=253017 RepID=UPI001FB08622|nr:uncharacterized protein LOC124931489 [Impatiens glandulifera]